jgi:bHLH factor
MDQAMGDLQNQLEEVKRMWEEERNARQRFELELEALRKSGSTSAVPQTTVQATKSPEATATDSTAGAKRKSEEASEQTSATGDGGGDRDGKRQRTE